MRYRFEVGSGDAGALDHFLARSLRLSRDKARDLAEFGAVYVNGKAELGPDRFLAPGDQVRVHFPRYGTRRFYESDPQRILYRDSWILAYNKEPGIPSQQTPYDAYNNVYAGLRRWLAAQARGTSQVRPTARPSEPAEPGSPGPAARFFGPARAESGAQGPGTVSLALHHRLDQEVSGVMLLSLSARANGPLSRAFRDRKVEKVYRVVVCGEPEQEEWAEDAPIGREGGRYLCTSPGRGKQAETGFRVLERAPGLALLEARPRTGRTHQIRLHLALRNLPVLGDRQYGGRPRSRCMLHAFRLSLDHPVSRERVDLEAPLPEEFTQALCPGDSMGP